ncbi:MAG: hypothetical protein ACO36E_02010 [Synechocystis sp.]
MVNYEREAGNSPIGNFAVHHPPDPWRSPLTSVLTEGLTFP